MPFFSNLKKVLNLGSGDTKKKRPNLSHIRVDQDPEHVWEIVGELGDGAFGKVHKVRHRHRDNLYAAAKICVLESDEELSDFMVEIDILSEVAHENIIKLYEAYFFQNKLWVSKKEVDLRCLLGNARCLFHVVMNHLRCSEAARCNFCPPE